MSFCTVCRDQVAHALLEDVMGEDHPELARADVKVGLLWVWADGKDDCALSLRGVPAAAIVGSNPWIGRLQGMPDATIRIDGRHWQAIEDDARRALLSHELTHLELIRDGKGAVKPDKAGRPSLTMRVHDYEIGIFRSVIEKYGKASLDAMHVKRLADDFHQLLFGWTDDAVGQVA